MPGNNCVHQKIDGLQIPRTEEEKLQEERCHLIYAGQVYDQVYGQVYDLCWSGRNFLTLVKTIRPNSVSNGQCPCLTTHIPPLFSRTFHSKVEE